MGDNSEMACVYATLILKDDGIPVTEEKIKTLIDAAGITVQPYWPGMFARLAESVNMDDLINNIGSAPAAAPAAGAAAAEGGAEEAKEEEKEESEEEEEEDLEFDLFD